MDNENHATQQPQTLHLIDRFIKCLIADTENDFLSWETDPTHPLACAESYYLEGKTKNLYIVPHRIEAGHDEYSLRYITKDREDILLTQELSARRTHSDLRTLYEAIEKKTCAGTHFSDIRDYIHESQNRRGGVNTESEPAPLIGDIFRQCSTSKTLKKLAGMMEKGLPPKGSQEYAEAVKRLNILGVSTITIIRLAKRAYNGIIIKLPTNGEEVFIPPRNLKTIANTALHMENTTESEANDVAARILYCILKNY